MVFPGGDRPQIVRIQLGVNVRYFKFYRIHHLRSLSGPKPH
jgi:hypothetical protein